MGAGPSLREVAPETLLRIQEAPAAKVAVNYAGRGPDGQGWLLKPTHWTAYDTTARFSRCVFNDPSITKLIRGSRATDLTPESTDKVYDCPATYFFDAEFRKYSNFVYATAEKVNDSLDSFVQAIDLAYLMGFRELYLLGADMRVAPSPEQINLAEQYGVSYPTVYEGRTSDRLKHFLDAYVKARGIPDKQAAKELEGVNRERQYAFSETKPFGVAVACDTHYWERVEYLRLARRTMSLAGLRIVSCTPGSRLNTWFEYMRPEAVCDYLADRHGDPRLEGTEGKYTEKQVHLLPWHADIAPYSRSDPPKMKRAVGPEVEAMLGVEVQG